MSALNKTMIMGVFVLIFLFIFAEMCFAQSNRREKNSKGNSPTIDYTYKGWGSLPNTHRGPNGNAYVPMQVRTYNVPGPVYYGPGPAYTGPYPGYPQRMYAGPAMVYPYRSWSGAYRYGIYGPGYYRNTFGRGMVLYYPPGFGGVAIPAPLGYRIP